MDVNTSAFLVGHDYKGGVLALAPLIGKNPSTFNAELAGVGTAKLGLNDALKMSVYTRDFRILDAFAASCGRMTLPLPEMLEMENSNCMRALADAARDFTKLVADVCFSLTDDVVSDNELALAENNMGRLIASGQAVLAAMTVLNKTNKPPELFAPPRGFGPVAGVPHAAERGR